MSEPILSIQDLDIRLPTQQAFIDPVHEITLSIREGEIVCLVGNSGSGKTVTAQSIMRLLDQAEYGEHSHILLDQQDLLNLPEVILRGFRGKKLGMIFQEPMTSLNPVLTIGKQIDEVLQVHLQYKMHQAKKRTLELLSEVGMTDPIMAYTQYPHQMSGGMRQRAMIAMALAGEPQILIADEPTTALDVTIQAQVLALIKKLGKERNMGILLITHDLGVVSLMADTVAVMNGGSIVEISSKEDFFNGPKNPYSQELLKCAIDLTIPIKEIQKVYLEPFVLEVKNLFVHYPIKKGVFQKTVGYVKAVDDISFTLRRGDTLAIVGESGSGKSSTAFAIMRLIDCAEGMVKFHDQNLLEVDAGELRGLRRYIQMIFQDPLGSLNPRMTVREILSEGWDAQNMYNSLPEREKEFIALLQSVNLPDDSLDRYPHEFSGGQHQRIAIARAIAMQPQVIVCDEPTSALDVSVQSQILALLKKLQAERQLSYVFISHNIPVVSNIAHHIAVMHQGKIVEYGKTQDILHSPKHPYTQSLLASVPIIKGEYQHESI